MKQSLNILFLNDLMNENYLNALLPSKDRVSINAEFFSNPCAAIDYLESCKDENFPNILVVDMNMPIMNGFEFAEYLLLNYYFRFPETRLFLMCNTVELSRLTEDANNPVISDFLQKPLTREVFLKKIIHAVKWDAEVQQTITG